jgi:predicted enzyme related to lactoylglutathione lyase
MNALVIFSVNVKALAGFYEAVLGLSPSPMPGDSKKDIRLGGDDSELLIHSIPDQIAKSIVIESPPVAIEDAAMKPVFDVKSIDEALKQVSQLGGIVTGRTFTLNGLTRHDIVDPEGNVVQLRSSSARSLDL